MKSDSPDQTPRGTCLSVACMSDVGRVRDVNEDAVVVADLTEAEILPDPVDLDSAPVRLHGFLLAVADGMGGAQAGEVASRMAVGQLADALIATADSRPLSEWLRAALKSVNQYIRRASLDNPDFQGMGATITAAIVYETGVIIGQVGDSRGYLIREGQVQQVTKDQSIVQALVDAGVITEQDAIKSPYRNVILHALGAEDDLEPELSAVTLARGDYLLLCSDGLSNKVGNVEMHDIVLEAESLSAACSRLVALANERGGEDNISVIVARFDGKQLPVLDEGADRRIRIERPTSKPDEH
jgi:serine/threonine protein phosphatase PrpC